MKVLIPLLLGLCVAMTSPEVQGKDNEYSVYKLCSMIDTSRVSAGFSCTLADTQTQTGIEGTVVAQWDCFYLSAAGMEFYCDSKSLWTVLPDEKEVVISNAPSLDSLLSEQWRIKSLKISGLSQKPASKDIKEFVFDVTSLDEEWIVTDTRE